MKFQVIVALLIASVILGILILALDGLLWFDNPKNGHAHALIAFTAVQLVLLAPTIAGKRWTLKIATIWSLVYLVLLILNPLTVYLWAPEITVADFAAYLFGISPIASFDAVNCPVLCPPFLISYDLLIVVQVLLAVSCIKALRRTST